MPVPLKCVSCSSPLSADAIDDERGLIKCGFCGSLMLLPAREAGRAARFVERGQLALPKGMSMYTTPHGVVLVRKWFSPLVFFLIPFCLAWNGFLVAWYAGVAMTGAPLVAKLLPLVHVAVGVGLGYYTLALLFNKTEIRVERGEVLISHSPLPWPGARQLPGVTIEQVYAKAHISHRKNGPRTDYQLWVIGAGGKHEKLHANQLSADQALFIEQQIEKALGIKDKEVSGELPRG
jgi:hypothetical protein